MGTFKKYLGGKTDKLSIILYVDREVEEEDPEAKRFEVETHLEGNSILMVYNTMIRKNNRKRGEKSLRLRLRTPVKKKKKKDLGPWQLPNLQVRQKRFLSEDKELVGEGGSKLKRIQYGVITSISKDVEKLEP